MKTVAPASASAIGRTTPRDFFLWAGALIALYGSVIAFITLLFEYINRTFPDPLAYWTDPYGGSVRFAMATLIVLVPTAIFLLRLIRASIVEDPSKANIWVRRWALMLTIFVAGSTVAIDLITLINTFLGGEVTTRFLLKVLVVLLVAAGITLHFLADLRGYWIENSRKANTIGYAVALLVLASIVAGFFIIGSPREARMLRYDEQKVGDLQNIQSQTVYFWQQKEELPESLSQLADPISGFTVPVDPQSGVAYRYEITDQNAFTICATFNQESPDTNGQGSYPSSGHYGDKGIGYPGMPGNDSWQHGVGETCFERTIDPELYPPNRDADPI